MVSQDTLKLPYKVIGFGFIAACLVLFFINPDIIYRFSMIFTGQDSFNLLYLVGMLSLLGAGIIDLLYGFGKLRINRLSNISVVLGLCSVFMAVVPPVLIVIFVFASGADAMGFILIFVPIMLAGLLALASLILLMASVFITIKRNKPDIDVRTKAVAHPRKD